VSATTNQPSNLNFLSPLGFNFIIKKLPNTNYFVQGVNIPSMTLGEYEFPSPFTKIPQPGTHLDFGDLTVSFRVDEDMKNFIEIYDWLVALGFPDDFSAYKDIKDASDLPGSGDGIFSDATLTVLTSAKNPNIEVRFQDVFPLSLDNLDFTYTGVDVDYIVATATFKYRRYEIVAL
jgi:hypothetical protein